MTKKEIQILFDYDNWANVKLLEVVASLKEDQYKKDLGASFNGIQGTLVHMLSADRVWLDRWTAKEPAPLKAEDFPTLEIIKKRWDTYQLEVSNFLQSLSEARLEEPFRYTDFKGNEHSQPRDLQMQHKVNHSTYHRGQVIVMMRQLGATVVSTDLINYIRQKETRG